MKRRVVITGMGAVTPIGNTVPEFWDGIRNGTVGIGEISKFDTEAYQVKLAAEVKGFDARERMDFKSAKRMELFSQYAVAAAKEAFEDAGLHMEEEDPYRVGTIVGSGIGSLQTAEREYGKILERGPARVNPLTVPLMISNMAAGNVSIQFGLKGKSSESAICPTAVAGFTNLTALTTSTDPARASIPFDRDRNGFVIGEGAGIVVLEELEHAKKRGAHIYAELAGYGATCDAWHITSPAEDGSGAAKAMELAVRESGLSKRDIGYINAHGTSTHHNDLFETRAIRNVFGTHADDLIVNSTKSMIGHLLGAAGAVELIVCVKTIREGFIHQTMGTNVLDPACDLDYAVGAPVERSVTCALSNSLGFGGHNASLLVKKYER